MTFLEITRARNDAGWIADAFGWTAPDGTPDYLWALEGLPFPEDGDYIQWADAYWHYERLDCAAP